MYLNIFNNIWIIYKLEKYIFVDIGCGDGYFVKKI